MPQRQVVDTSAWIEWLSDTALGQSLVQDFPEPEHCIVPTMVLLELSKWLHRGTHGHDPDAILAIATGCDVQQLDEETAFLAAECGRLHRLSTADSAIYATARRHNADLITCDADFKDLPSVRFYSKEAKSAPRDTRQDPHGDWQRWPTTAQFESLTTPL